MAADVTPKTDCPNPLCSAIKRRHLKMQEGRDCLRKAVKILEEQLDTITKEKADLKRAHEELLIHEKQNKEAMDTESRIRDKLQKEIHDLKAEISSYQKNECFKSTDENEIQLLRGRIFEAEEEIRSLKHLLEKEKQKTDSEKKKSVLEKKKAEEAWKLVKLEKNKAEEERRVAEIEKKKAEQCRICLENLEHEANEVRKKLTAEMFKAEGSRKMVEEERQKTIKEKKRAESERVKADNQKRLMEVERRKGVEQKASADHLSQMLEEEKRGREELQKKLEEAVSAAKVRCMPSTKDDRYHGGTSNVNLLREELKLEKKQVKHAKRMAKIEKAEKKFIKQELHLLKQNFMQVFCRFSMLNDHLLLNIEGGETKSTDQCFMQIGKYSGMVGRNNLLDPEGSNRNSSISLGPIETCCTGPLDCTEPERQSIDLPLSRECRTRPITGIISESESPVGGSVQNKSQSSAVCSNTTSFSDERSMGSQGRDFIGVTTSAKLKKYSSTVPKLPSGVAKTRKNKGTTGSPNNTRKSGQTEVENAHLITSSRDALAVTDPEPYRSSKRRKIQGQMEHVSLVRSADTGMHIVGLLPLRNTDGSLPAVKLSSMCGVSKDIDSRIDFVNKKQDELYRNIYDPSSKITVKEQQTYGHQKKIDNFDSQRRQDFLGGTVVPSHQVVGNVCIEQTVNTFSKERDDLVYFENMISGNYMKLLNLENDADEEKYRLAFEMPLSPYLPIVEPSDCQLRLDNSQYLTEKQKSMPCHSFDVMDLEVSCNSSKLKTSNTNLDVLSCGKHDVACPVEGPANSCPTTLCSYASRHDELHDGKQKTYVPATSKTPEEITKMACDDINKFNTVPSLLNSGDHQQAKPLLPCHLDPKAFPKSSTFLAAANAETDKSLLLGNAADPYTVLEDGCFQSCSTEIHNLVTSTSLVLNKTLGHSDATDLGLIENPMKGGGVPSDGSLFSRSINEMLAPEMRKFPDSDNNIGNAGQAEPSSICQSSEGSEQISLCGSPKIVDLCRGNAEVEGCTPPSYCVLFSKMERKDSILRMLSLKNKFKHQNLMTSQTDHVLVEVLNALTVETALLPEEKVSILFSTLLCNISSRLEANSKRAMADDLLLCLECFAVEINRVMSDGEIASRFQETCLWDILVCLIEDFLIEREVLMCMDRQYEPMCSSDSCSDILEVDGGQVHVYSRAATVYQYVAGCVILASLSSAFDESSFLHEVSYKILLTCKSDTYWALLALHAFASVCGKEFFEINEHSLLIAAIRSVVSLLEGGDGAAPLVSPRPRSGSTLAHKFAPCKECPFAIGAMCMDNLTDMLLEVLQCCLTRAENSNVTESFAVAIPTVSAGTEVDVHNSDSRSKLDGLIGCDEFHRVLDFRSDLPRCVPRRPFCYFADIVSLVELVSFYMGWNWTYKKIIPHLSNMLESCISIEFSAGLVVLIGQLGRFGIDVGGYQQTGIPELRCSLFVILDACDAKKKSFQTQLAAVGALLNLLPLSFEDIVDDHQELPVDASLSGQAERIKKWFCELSRQQQSICMSLFGESNFCEKMASVHEI